MGPASLATLLAENMDAIHHGHGLCLYGGVLGLKECPSNQYNLI